MLTRVEITKEYAHFEEVRDLYLRAFPDEERVPLWSLMRKTKRSGNQFLAFEDEGQFVGLTYEITEGDLTLLFFLAVNDQVRSKGYGSRILEDIRTRHAGNRVIIEIEPVDAAAENAGQREKRRAFYLRNGFEPAGFNVREQGVEYEILSAGGPVTPDDFMAIMRSYSGRILSLFFRVAVVRPDAD